MEPGLQSQQRGSLAIYVPCGWNSDTHFHGQHRCDKKVSKEGMQTEQPPQSFSTGGILSMKRNWDLPCCPRSLNLAPEESQISGPQSTNTLLVHPHGHPACVCIPHMLGNSHLRYFSIVFEELCYSKRASSPGVTSILCPRPRSSAAASPLGQLSTPLVWIKCFPLSKLICWSSNPQCDYM